MASNINEAQLIQLIRDEYNKRLHEVVTESDMFDDRGNMILGKDLKVRHKATGFEYTINDVGENEVGGVEVTLNLPEDPRITPPGSIDKVNLSVDGVPLADNSEGDGEVFVINQQEFEREYEVE